MLYLLADFWLKSGRTIFGCFTVTNRVLDVVVKIVRRPCQGFTLQELLDNVTSFFAVQIASLAVCGLWEKMARVVEQSTSSRVQVDSIMSHSPVYHICLRSPDRAL